MSEPRDCIHPLSLAVTQIVLKRVYRDGTNGGSSIGTGFFWKKGDRSFIITNWHNFTGLNQQTGKPIGGFCPNIIEFVITVNREVKGETARSREWVKVPLLEDDDLTRRWLEHPDGNKIDVAAIDITDILEKYDYAGKTANKINEISSEDFSATVAMDCFIVGFPQGLSGPAITPIWKRGTIAAETHVAENGREPEVTFVDTATRPGMSGSPVLVRHSGPVYVSRLGKSFWTAEYVFGIYSGRVDDDPLGVQLGRVWPIARIDEMLDHAASEDVKSS